MKSPFRHPPSEELRPRPRPVDDQAFTLIELLVVISIIGVLAALILPVAGAAVDTANRTQTLSNIRQLSQLMLEYININNGITPEQGYASSETWSTVGLSSNYWYNALPRMAGMKGAADYASTTAGRQAFYSKSDILFCSGAIYPSTKASLPNFAITMNSKLVQGTATTTSIASIQQPSRTVAFLENGLSSETQYNKKESGYTGQQAYTFASRFVARYQKDTLGIISFFDGHAELLNGGQVVCTNGSLGTVGKAYYPPQNSPGPELIWCPDPNTTPN